MPRARSAAAILAASLALVAACGDTEPPEGAAEETTTTEETSTSSTTTTSSSTTTTEATPLTTEEAMDFVASQDGTYGRWVPEPGTYDAAAPLSAIVGATPSGTGSSPMGLFFFADGRPVDVEAEPRSGIHIDGTDDGTVTVSFAHYAPDDPHCCPSLSRYLVRFRWNGDVVEVLDPYPPEDQGFGADG